MSTTTEVLHRAYVVFAAVAIVAAATKCQKGTASEAEQAPKDEAPHEVADGATPVDSPQFGRERLRQVTSAENADRLKRLQTVLAEGPAGENDVRAAAALRERFMARASNEIARTDVVCRALACEIAIAFKHPEKEQGVVNRLAADRAAWSTGFVRVDYIPIETGGGIGRFALWKDAPSAL